MQATKIGLGGQKLYISPHYLKTDEQAFRAILAGTKKSEVRNWDDREFLCGDTLYLREWDGSKFTGREITAAVTHIQAGYGLPGGLCVLSINVTEVDI